MDPRGLPGAAVRSGADSQSSLVGPAGSESTACLTKGPSTPSCEAVMWGVGPWGQRDVPGQWTS